MGSFANILLFIPLLFCSMLGTMKSACCSLGMSAGHYLTTLAYQTAQTAVHPFRVCYDTFIRRYNALVSCCWTRWSFAYTVMSHPFVFCADLLKRLIKLMTKFAHICNAAIDWWLRFALSTITTPWRTTCYALSSFSNTRQLFSSWAHIFIELSSCAGTIVLAIWTQLKKESLQLLWALTPFPCKTVYTWLWPGTRQRSSSPQASSTSGVSSKSPSMVVSPTDSGTEADSAANVDTVKAHHPSNDSIGEGAASSSSPRSTLAGGAVFAGEPMPISDTQFLAPRLASLMWDRRVRGMMFGPGIVPYGGGFRLTQCDFNPAYYQLDPAMYPAKFGLIGEGAQGTVIYVQYRDAHGEWTPAAVKWVEFMEPAQKASVKREVMCLKALQHSNHIPALVSVDGAKCGGMRFKFITMRLIEKVDMDAYFDGLRNLETEATLNTFLNEVTRTFGHIVQGVADMHDADWAHLDLKPANLCMEISNGQTQTFMVDFGSSMQGLDTEPEEKLWSTQAIAAPEVIRTYQEGATAALYRQARSGPQDSYSLGCILLWLWTGDLPFDVSDEECDIHNITSKTEYLGLYLKKQAQGAAKLHHGTSIANSSLTQFAEDTLRLKHPKLNKLYSIAANLLRTDRDERSTVWQVLAELQTLSQL